MFTLLELRNPATFARFTQLCQSMASRCCICKQPFTQGDRQSEDVHRTKNGLACGNCYYGALGEMVELNPILRGGLRRG